MVKMFKPEQIEDIRYILSSEVFAACEMTRFLWPNRFSCQANLGLSDAQIALISQLPS